MCGIAGLLEPDATTAGPELSRLCAEMAGTLAHRGPDDGGTWSDPAAGVGLGYRRLAVVDTSPAGRQPMVSASRRTVLVLNGEIYNHGRLREQLLAAGVPFRGRSDTEVLCEAIDAWGIEATLPRLDGMFAMAVWEVQEGTLWLARDRLGEKPLYYGRVGGRFAFASELRALRRLPGFRADVDPAAVASVVRWSFVTHPLSIYAGISTLPPGGMVRVRARNGQVAHDLSRWWSLDDVIAAGSAARATPTAPEAEERLVELLRDAVADRLQADVPVGAFLSGGTDSSLVVALARGHLPGRLRTFNVAMPEVGFDESRDAAAVAAHLGTDHTSVELSVAEALALVPRLADIYDEPFGDPSMLPTALLCRSARQSLIVCLSGDGGDEVFGGYNRHVFGHRLWHGTQWLPAAARRAAGAALLVAPPRLVDAGASLATRARAPNRRPRNPGDKVQRLAGLLAAGDDELWDGLASTWPRRGWPLSGPVPRAPCGPAGGLTPIEALLRADTAVVLPDQMLVKVDRASMAFGLEVRVPLLDPALVAWAWTLPIDQKVGGGEGKRILRRVLRRHLPAELVDRPKMGFDPPVGTWLRGPLRPWAEEQLLERRLQDEGWLDAGVVRRTWAEHQSGRRNWDQRLWTVLMLQAWLERWGRPQP